MANLCDMAPGVKLAEEILAFTPAQLQAINDLRLDPNYRTPEYNKAVSIFSAARNTAAWSGAWFPDTVEFARLDKALVATLIEPEDTAIVVPAIIAAMADKLPHDMLSGVVNGLTEEHLKLMIKPIDDAREADKRV